MCCGHAHLWSRKKVQVQGARRLLVGAPTPSWIGTCLQVLSKLPTVLRMQLAGCLRYKLAKSLKHIAVCGEAWAPIWAECGTACMGGAPPSSCHIYGTGVCLNVPIGLEQARP